MNNGFFALAARMKYINRWALMRNVHAENLAEHSFDVAVISHALVTIANVRFKKNLNSEKAALLGLFHDMPETLTGDLPTPVKYYSPDVRSAYQTVEENACKKIISMLPEDLRKEYEFAFEINEENAEIKKYVKAADKISALIKCFEEQKAGNSEFNFAATETEKTIRNMNMPEAEIFIDEFLPSYLLSLDELG
ncbi:MAG: 5'-deoxynucleotidase [Clostridiales bacterium]|nr:5'-deoxynucleotidase [Clostridiales bacterium]